ncbi:MAG: ribosomal protein S18-alanine N-acetyltransferase [Ilumatobacteraceae bacterium]
MSVLSRLLPRGRDGTGDVAIEPMRHRHVGQVLDIEQVSYPKPWSARVFHDELDQAKLGHRTYLVAKHGRTVVAYGGLMFAPDEAHVTNIAVRPEHRRRHVAQRLLGQLADDAISRGCGAWTLEVRASSTGAQALYRSFGFAPAGIRARYYEGTEDAIVMWCHGIQSAEYRHRLEGLLADDR